MVCHSGLSNTLSEWVVPIYTSQACHDDLFSLPMNADVAPQPVINEILKLESLRVVHIASVP